jgi:hypothetical protein
MAIDIRVSDLCDLLEQYHLHYEVCPYYVLLDQRAAGDTTSTQRIQAGFDVNLYGNLEKPQFPLFRSEAANRLVDYFQSIARGIQLRAGNRCTIEITPCTNSVILDPRQTFRPEGMLRIRISHDRGLQHAQGPSEELALKALQDVLSELGIRRA